MSTQELIERLRDVGTIKADDAYDGVDPRVVQAMRKVTEVMHAAADRLASLSAENAALKAKLAGVDEKGLEAAAAAIHRFREIDESPAAMRVHFEDADPLTKQARRTDARAAIAAYLAAVDVEQ